MHHDLRIRPQKYGNKLKKHNKMSVKIELGKEGKREIAQAGKPCHNNNHNSHL